MNTTNITTLDNEDVVFEVTTTTNKLVIWYGYLWRWWYTAKMNITRPFRLRKIRKAMHKKPKLIIPKH